MNGRPASVSTSCADGPHRRRRTARSEDRAGRDDPDDDPVPNLERLVAEAMSMAATTGGDGPDLADLVNRYWRLVPDEDLGDRTVGRDARRPRGTISSSPTQRLPGEMKLHIEQTRATARSS